MPVLAASNVTGYILPEVSPLQVCSDIVVYTPLPQFFLVRFADSEQSSRPLAIYPVVRCDDCGVQLLIDDAPIGLHVSLGLFLFADWMPQVYLCGGEPESDHSLSRKSTCSQSTGCPLAISELLEPEQEVQWWHDNVAWFETEDLSYRNYIARNLADAACDPFYAESALSFLKTYPDNAQLLLEIWHALSVKRLCNLAMHPEGKFALARALHQASEQAVQRWVCDLACHVMQMLRHEHGCTMWDTALARDDLTPDTLAVVASHILCAEKSDVRKLIQHPFSSHFIPQTWQNIARAETCQ